MTDDPTVGTAEAARLLGVSEQRVRQLTANGKLPAVKLYGQWRIPRETVQARMKERGTELGG